MHKDIPKTDDRRDFLSKKSNKGHSSFGQDDEGALIWSSGELSSSLPDEMDIYIKHRVNNQLEISSVLNFSTLENNFVF